jgi:peptide-methionine (R)-S-oxide reductase
MSKPSIKKDEQLSSELYQIARQKGTETPFTGKYWNHHEKGIYKCAICDSELFSSDTKFDSGSGWPSFSEPANLKNITLKEDLSHGMKRTEVLCKNCGAHLGHVFEDGPTDKGGKRYCINSVCLLFKEK